MKYLQRCFFFILTIIISNKIEAQKILLVDDNDYIIYNSDTLINDLNDTGFEVDVYNIESHNGQPPSLNELFQYSLVIWYASTDGVGLDFWEPQTNQILKSYLDAGKILWVIGLDILYDKYGKAPKSFMEGDFEYDYLGIQKYDAQSFEDDGGTGCAEMIRAQLAPQDLPNKIQWSLPTLWYADACELTPKSQPLYYMGPASYILAGGISMWYHRKDKIKAMVTFFEPALIDTYNNRLIFLKAIITNLQLPSAVQQLDEQVALTVFPNPTTNFIKHNVTKKISAIKIYSANTGLVKDILSPDQSIDVSMLNSGLYLLKIITVDNKLLTTTFLKL